MSQGFYRQENSSKTSKGLDRQHDMDGAGDVMVLNTLTMLELQMAVDM